MEIYQIVLKFYFTVLIISCSTPICNTSSRAQNQNVSDTKVLPSKWTQSFVSKSDKSSPESFGIYKIGYNGQTNNLLIQRIDQNQNPNLKSESKVSNDNKSEKQADNKPKVPVSNSIQKPSTNFLDSPTGLQFIRLSSLWNTMRISLIMRLLLVVFSTVMLISPFGLVSLPFTILTLVSTFLL